MYTSESMHGHARKDAWTRRRRCLGTSERMPGRIETEAWGVRSQSPPQFNMGSVIRATGESWIYIYISKTLPSSPITTVLQCRACGASRGRVSSDRARAARLVCASRFSFPAAISVFADADPFCGAQSGCYLRRSRDLGPQSGRY